MKLFADHQQIHVLAPDAKGDLAEAWTAKASDDRIAAAGDIVGIGTEAADEVDVTVEILETAPEPLQGDHVTEASIQLGAKVAVMGCTDYLPDAKRYSVTPGWWRLRATHTNLEKREKIRIQLWPAKRAAPKVVTRWKPPKPAPKKASAGKPKNRKQAVAAALRGEIDDALAVLLALHEKGDASASASAAEILAFQGRWGEMVPCAKALLANPSAVYARNVSDDMKALLAVKEGAPEPALPPEPRRERFEEGLKMATEGKRFKGKPKELARHCFALAVVFGIDDEIIARWDPAHPFMHFDQAADVARALVRRGEPAHAWEVLESRLSRWYPVDAAQVLPVVLLTDPWLAPLMTKERAARVLATPRAV
ncbi:MAG: hypothetical protein JST00_21540 [Deltaproteobacteria bacterium]|nr:hypothetical protein [Deltaproteobacteria bacterium]